MRYPRNDADHSRVASGALAQGAVILLALAVRVWGLQAQSFSADEIVDAQSARGSLSEILFTADGFPPLYGLLVHAWSSVLPHDLPARWLSAIIGVLTVPAMWRLGTRIGGRRVGLWAAVALALSPLHVWVSQEARAYALYVLFAVVALWLFFQALSTNRGTDWLRYVVACAAGLYTHYYFALLPLTTGLMLVEERRRRPADLMPGLVANGAVALTALSLLPFLRADLQYQAAYPHEAPFNLVTVGYTYFSFLAGFTVGPSLRELHYLPTATSIRMVLPWALLIGLAFAVLSYAAWRCLRASADSRRAGIRLAALATIPVLAGGVLAQALGVGFRARYLIWVAVPLLLIVACGIASPWRPWLRAGGVLSFSVVWVTALMNRRTDPRHQNEDMHAVADYLRSHSRPSIPVFVMSHYMAFPATYYLGPRWNVCALPNLDTGAADVSGPVRVIYTRTSANSPFWFVYSRPFHSDPEGRLLGYLRDTGVIRPRVEFAGVALYEGRALPLGTPLAPLGCETRR